MGGLEAAVLEPVRAGADFVDTFLIGHPVLAGLLIGLAVLLALFNPFPEED